MLNRKPAGRVAPQVILGIVIAIAALVMFWNKQQVNPVTGEKQFVSLTPQQEVALGMQAAPEMAAKMGGTIQPPDPQAKLVREVGERIVKYSQAARSPYRFEFHLLRDPRTINAFALPGGQVFITKALLDRLETEAQLGGVLGHEVAHVIHRHSAEHMAKGQLGQMLATAVGVAATDDRGHGYSAAMIAQTVNQMMQLRYGRNDESEADSYGLRYMADAGYTPEAMLGVMRVLKEASSGSRQPEFLSTHPDPGNRYEAVREFIAKNYPGGIPGSLTQGVSLKQYLR